MRDRQERRQAYVTTVAFKTTERRKALIQAAAARRGISPSTYLREAADRALEDEFGLALTGDGAGR